MDLSLSLFGALAWLCYAVIIGFVVRYFAAKFPESPISKALLFTVG